MKEVTITRNEYEVGDIIAIHPQLQKRKGFKDVEGGLVIDVKETKYGVTYWILTDKKNKIRIPNDMIKYTEYCDMHIDMRSFEAICAKELTYEEQVEEYGGAKGHE